MLDISSQLFLSDDDDKYNDDEETEDYEPTEEEIYEYAKVIGIDPENEKELLPIAREGIVAPLPDHWKPCEADNGNIYYFNFRTGQSIWEHPCDDRFRDLVLKERQRIGKGKVSGSLNPMSTVRLSMPTMSKISLAPLKVGPSLGQSLKGSGSLGSFGHSLLPPSKGLLGEAITTTEKDGLRLSTDASIRLSVENYLRGSLESYLNSSLASDSLTGPEALRGTDSLGRNPLTRIVSGDGDIDDDENDPSKRFSLKLEDLRSRNPQLTFDYESGLSEVEVKGKNSDETDESSEGSAPRKDLKVIGDDITARVVSVMKPLPLPENGDSLKSMGNLNRNNNNGADDPVDRAPGVSAERGREVAGGRITNSDFLDTFKLSLDEELDAEIQNLQKEKEERVKKMKELLEMEVAEEAEKLRREKEESFNKMKLSLEKELEREEQELRLEMSRRLEETRREEFVTEEADEKEGLRSMFKKHLLRRDTDGTSFEDDYEDERRKLEELERKFEEEAKAKISEAEERWRREMGEERRRLEEERQRELSELRSQLEERHRLELDQCRSVARLLNINDLESSQAEKLLEERKEKMRGEQEKELRRLREEHEEELKRLEYTLEEQRQEKVRWLTEATERLLEETQRELDERMEGRRRRMEEELKDVEAEELELENRKMLLKLQNEQLSEAMRNLCPVVTTSDKPKADPGDGIVPKNEPAHLSSMDCAVRSLDCMPVADDDSQPPRPPPPPPPLPPRHCLSADDVMRPLEVQGSLVPAPEKSEGATKETKVASNVVRCEPSPGTTADDEGGEETEEEEEEEEDVTNESLSLTTTATTSSSWKQEEKKAKSSRMSIGALLSKNDLVRRARNFLKREKMHRLMKPPEIVLTSEFQTRRKSTKDLKSILRGTPQLHSYSSELEFDDEGGLSTSTMTSSLDSERKKMKKAPLREAEDVRTPKSSQDLAEARRLLARHRAMSTPPVTSEGFKTDTLDILRRIEESIERINEDIRTGDLTRKISEKNISNYSALKNINVPSALRKNPQGLSFDSTDLRLERKWQAYFGDLPKPLPVGSYLAGH